MNSDIYENTLVAIEENNVERVKTLLQGISPSDLFGYRAEEGSSLPLVAAQRGRSKIFRLFLDLLDDPATKAEILKVDFLTCKDVRLLTKIVKQILDQRLLTFAIGNHYDETLKILLTEESEIPTEALFIYYSLFQVACSKGDEETVKKLLARNIRLSSTFEILSNEKESKNHALPACDTQ